MKPSRMIGTGLAVFLGVVVALLVVRLLPDSLNPFSQRTVDRSPPPVLQSIEDIGEYRASSAKRCLDRCEGRAGARGCPALPVQQWWPRKH